MVGRDGHHELFCPWRVSLICKNWGIFKPFLFFSKDTLNKVYTAANELMMYGEKYAWFAGTKVIKDQKGVPKNPNLSVSI